MQRKTQCLWQNLIAKVLWHIKSRYLPKAPSQSPEFSGAEFGEKNAGSTGENAYQGGNRQTIQEFCFAEFLSFCTRLFLKLEFSDAKQETKPAYYPRILLCRILALLHKAVAKIGATRRKRGNRQTIPRILLCRITQKA